MENQENQALDREYKIYIPSTHQFVPVTKEVYYDYYRPIWRIRKQAQKYGQCMCPQSKLWRCDGCCLDCPYHAAGNMSSLDYERELIGDVHEDLSANVEGMVTDRVALQQLLRRFEELSPGASRIIELRLEGLPDRDIADIVGIPRSTFRSRLDKVISQLREEFGDII